ncbi:MAG: sulfite exporter TauE/SafE family protein [Betaproteobacteria bacterium]|nr:sulfite exporter TauE/SafE family protein [Betaproteobacteria bacterium]
MSDAYTLIPWIALVFFIAGVVKGVVGMGLPTVAMGLLSLTLAPAAAAAILVAPSLVTNVWQYLAGPATRAVTQRLLTMMIAVVMGTFIGIGVLVTHANTAAAAIGVLLALYGAFGLATPRLSVPTRAEPLAAPAVGLITGVLSGATGIFTIPAVPYFTALGLTRDELIQALGLSFTVSTVALGLALAWRGQYPLSLAGASLAAIIPALAGMLLGQRVRDKLKPQVFRRWFFVSLMGLGAYMVGRAW